MAASASGLDALARAAAHSSAAKPTTASGQARVLLLVDHRLLVHCYFRVAYLQLLQPLSNQQRKDPVAVGPGQARRGGGQKKGASTPTGDPMAATKEIPASSSTDRGQSSATAVPAATPPAPQSPTAVRAGRSVPKARPLDPQETPPPKTQFPSFYFWL